MPTPADEKPQLKLTDFVIRPITTADLRALEWDGAYTNYRRLYADLVRDARSGRVLMWMIESPLGEMIGQVFVMLRSNQSSIADGKNRAYVFAFRIKPAWRNRGIGRYLMQFVEDDLYQRGFRTVTLNVAKDNLRAQRLYQRLGYQVFGSSPGVWSYKDHLGRIRHVNEPAWRMSKTLPAQH